MPIIRAGTLPSNTTCPIGLVPSLKNCFAYWYQSPHLVSGRGHFVDQGLAVFKTRPLHQNNRYLRR